MRREDRNFVSRTRQPAGQVVHEPLRPAADLGPVRRMQQCDPHLQDQGPVADRRARRGRHTGQVDERLRRQVEPGPHEAAWRSLDTNSDAGGGRARSRPARGPAPGGGGRGRRRLPAGRAGARAPEDAELERAPLHRVLGDHERDRMPPRMVAHGVPYVPGMHGVPHAAPPPRTRPRHPPRALAARGPHPRRRRSARRTRRAARAARAGTRCCSSGTRHSVPRSPAWWPARRGAPARRGPARSGPAARGRRPRSRASSSRSSQSGAGLQSSSVKATSGAAAARQPRFRLAAALESGAPVRKRTGSPSGAVAFGAGSSARTTTTSNRSRSSVWPSERLEREGEARLAARGGDDHGDVRSGSRSHGRPHYARGLCGS